jgi:multiple sugar transport system ATP-binding protein
MNFLPPPPGWTVPSGGRPVRLGIRPEDLVPAEAAGPRRFSGRVLVVEPLGPHTLLSVQLDQERLRVAVEPDRPIRPGDIIHLEPRPERVRWFDSETGEAVP